MSDKDTQLVDGLRAGHPESFEELVRSYGGRLLATATRMLGNTQDAEDAIQESLIAAWKAIAQFNGASSLYTWLHRIAVNSCLAKMRTAGAKSEISMATADRSIGTAFEELPAAWSEPGPSPEQRITMRRSIERALQLIPADLRTVLLLRDVEDLTSQEVAAKMGLSDAAVRQRLHRARTAMAELLRPELCQGRELTCGGDLDLLLDYIDKALPLEQQQLIQEHLDSCDACGTLLASYRMTVGVPRAIVDLTGEAAVSDSFVARTVESARRSG